MSSAGFRIETKAVEVEVSDAKTGMRRLERDGLEGMDDEKKEDNWTDSIQHIPLELVLAHVVLRAFRLGVVEAKGGAHSVLPVMNKDLRG